MRAALLATFVLLVAIPAAAEESVQLEWRLDVGDRYAIERTTLTKTTTLTEVAGRHQSQDETQSMTMRYVLEVREVLESRNLSLRLTTDAGVMEKSNASGSQKLTLKRSETGEKQIEVEIAGGGPQAAAMRTVMEALGSELMDLVIDFEATPRGHIVSSKIQGDLFGSLPQDDEALVLVGRILKELMPMEELAGAATADGFPLLPEGPTPVGGSWPVHRSLALMGLSLDGRGTGRLAGVEAGEARLEEHQVYQVDVSGLEDRMERMMGLLYEQMELPVGVRIAFDPVEPLEVRSTSRFDLEDGCVTTTNWETMEIALDGVMEISLRGETQEATLSVETEADVKLVWKKLP